MWIYVAVIIMGIVVGAVIRSKYERTHLEIERYNIRSEKLKENERYTFVFLSDLHSNTFGEGNCKLIAEIDNLKPDMVLIGGDMVVAKGKGDTQVAIHLIKELSGRYPIYYCNGNHEDRMKEDINEFGDLYKSYYKKLSEYGAVILENQTMQIEKQLVISGLDLERCYYKKLKSTKMEENYISNCLGEAKEEYFNILLAHNPLFFESYSKWGADLTLSGHFHGGTIRLPFLGGVMTPQFHFFLPYCAGLFIRHNKRMIVSTGLGTHSINIRLFNKPQLIVIQLESD